MVMKKLVHKIVNLLKVKNKFKIMFVLLFVIQQLINTLMEKYVYNHAYYMKRNLFKQVIVNNVFLHVHMMLKETHKKLHGKLILTINKNVMLIIHVQNHNIS